MIDESLYHVNGTLVPADEATVNVRDRGFMYGDAAFETCRVYGGTIFEWDVHADRLDETCAALELEHGLTRDDLKSRVTETVTANNLHNGSVRLSISRGTQPGKLTPKQDITPTIVVTCSSLPRGGVDGKSTWNELAAVRTVTVRRVPKKSVPSHVKTHNYLNGILARLELRGTDATEALMVDTEGFISEGATSNVFFVNDGTLHTPSLAGPVLPGVTRAIVIELAREDGISVMEGRYSMNDLLSADEAFLTNTSSEVWPIRRIDDHELGGAGLISTRLAELFDERVENMCYK